MRKLLMVVLMISSVVLMIAESAQGSVISAGEWATLNPARINNDGKPFWDNRFPVRPNDCSFGSFVLTSCAYPVAGATTAASEWRYLHDGSGGPIPFAFSPEDWQHGWLVRIGNNHLVSLIGWHGEDGSYGFLFDKNSRSGDGVAFNPAIDYAIWNSSPYAVTSSNGPGFERYALMRRVIKTDNVRIESYRIGFESSGIVPCARQLEDEIICPAPNNDFTDLVLEIDAMRWDGDPLMLTSFASRTSKSDVPEASSVIYGVMALLSAGYTKRRWR